MSYKDELKPLELLKNLGKTIEEADENNGIKWILRTLETVICNNDVFLSEIKRLEDKIKILETTPEFFKDPNQLKLPL